MWPSSTPIHAEHQYPIIRFRLGENALASDPESAFGCVIAFDSVVEKETAESIGNHFFECMIAPGYQSDALEILSNGKNRRMLTLDPLGELIDEPKIRQVQGGWLSQIQGIHRIDWENVRHVTEKTLDEDELNLSKVRNLSHRGSPVKCNYSCSQNRIGILNCWSRSGSDESS